MTQALINRRNMVLRTAQLSLALNGALCVVKFAAGYWGNAYVLIADGIESLTDVFASVLLLLGLRYALKPADKDHPYGHGRLEPLLVFGITVLLLLAAGGIAWQSIDNIRTPHSLPEPFTLPVLIAVVLIKEGVSRWITRRSSTTQSAALKGDAWHHRSDAITSGAAAVGLTLALFMGPGFETADDWAALLSCFFILYNAYLLFRPAWGEVMDENTHHQLIEDIRRESLTVAGVLATEKCHVRKTGMVYHIDLHLLVNGKLSVEAGHEIAHNLKDHLMQAFPEIVNVLTHIEPHTAHPEVVALPAIKSKS